MKRLLLGLVLAVVGLLAMAGPAAAVPDIPLPPITDLPGIGVPGLPGIPTPDCTADVPITSPGTGIANNIDPGPANPRTGTPFGDNPESSIYETSGYAFSWPSLRSGCSPTDLVGADNAEDLGGSAWGAVANFMLVGISFGVAVVVLLLRYAYAPSTLEIFNPVQELAANALGSTVFMVLFGLFLVAAAVVMLFRHRDGDVRGALTHGGWVLALTVGGVAATLYPLSIGPAVDNAVTGLVAQVNSTVAKASGNDTLSAADGVGANVVQSVLYPTWCAGMVGRFNGETADEFCPRLLAASTITRAEWAEAQGDPEKMTALKEAKQEAFLDVADDLEKADPAAYEYLNGEHNDHRTWYAALGGVGMLCATLFIGTAGVLLLYGLIVLRVAIMLFPLVAMLGVIPSARHFVTKVVDYSFGALVTAVTFGAIAAVFTAMVGAFLAPGTNIPPLVAMVLLLLTTFAAWKVTKPHRRVRAVLGLTPKNREPGDTKKRWWDEDEPQANEPRKGKSGKGAGTAAEASKPSIFTDAAKGAAQGAAAATVLGIMSGGTVTAAAAAAGAAKDAAGSAAANRAANNVAALPAADTATAPGTPELTTAATAATATTPRPTGYESSPGLRVFNPGEHTDSTLRVVTPEVTENGDQVLNLFTPDSEDATL